MRISIRKLWTRRSLPRTLTLVRVLLLQGKAARCLKSRQPAKSAPCPLKKPLKQRSATSALDRKENLAQQAGPSRSGSRLNKTFKSKSRKDLAALKAKNAPTDKAKHAKRGPKVKKDTDSIHLREICFIKNGDGKTVIAKYKNKDDVQFDDNLVVSWGAGTSKPHIFTQKTRVASAPPFPGTKYLSEPGTSKQAPAVRVHNFGKCPSKGKLKKHPLRRLASATDALGKIDKAKKKKLKAK